MKLVNSRTNLILEVFWTFRKSIHNSITTRISPYCIKYLHKFVWKSLIPERTSYWKYLSSSIVRNSPRMRYLDSVSWIKLIVCAKQVSMHWLVPATVTGVQDHLCSFSSKINGCFVLYCWSFLLRYEMVFCSQPITCHLTTSAVILTPCAGTFIRGLLN